MPPQRLSERWRIAALVGSFLNHESCRKLRPKEKILGSFSFTVDGSRHENRQAYAKNIGSRSCARLRRVGGSTMPDERPYRLSDAL